MEKNNKVSKPNIDPGNYGVSADNPVLMSSIPASRMFCEKLAKLDDHLSFIRRGSTVAEGFKKPIDIYDFSRAQDLFSTVYIYVYHHQDVEEVPLPFMNLQEEGTTKQIPETEPEIGSIEWLEALLEEETEEPSQEERFFSLITLILNYHGMSAPERLEKQETIPNENEQEIYFLIRELGLSPLLEPLVLEEWKMYIARTHRPHREFFVHSFLSSYHHSKLQPFLPKEARKKSQQLERAFDSLLKVINSIQFYADAPGLQERIESNLKAEHGTSLLKRCTTRFCMLDLYSDFSGRTNLDFWLDGEIDKLLHEKPLSTLLRKIYELTPGQENHVSCRSLSDDSKEIYKEMLDRAKFDDIHKIVQAKDPVL